MGHSFIQNRKSCFFFREAEKKNTSLFFFSWKSSYAIHSKFHGFNVIFNKMGCFFFPEILAFFCFFFSWKSSHVHSFIRSQSCFFFFPVSEKKNSFFIHSIGFAQKCVKNELFRGNKKIRYLWLASSLPRFWTE